jgi:hypothetical protein
MDLAPGGTEDSLATLGGAVRELSVPQTFPDDTLKQPPRLAKLACLGGGQPCPFTLVTMRAASHLTVSE